MARLEKAVKDGKIFTHDRRTILEMSKKVLENIAAKYHNIQKEVKEIIGGRVLDYKGWNIFYEGIERGRREANLDTARRLRDAGMDDSQIQKFTNLSLEDLRMM